MSDRLLGMLSGLRGQREKLQSMMAVIEYEMGKVQARVRKNVKNI